MSDIVKRWKPKRADVEREDGRGIPSWAHHLGVGGFAEQGWAAYDQRQNGKKVASGEWGDEIFLMQDGSIACTRYPDGRDAWLERRQ